jgi:exosortase
MTQPALNPKPNQLKGFLDELAEAWRRLPSKGLFFTLLAVWLVLFQFLGNSTFGYIDTPSLFRWMYNAYVKAGTDDSHGLLMPLVVLALFYWKRDRLLKIPHGTWWPGLLILAASLALHLLGYAVQQPRISIVALFIGIYGLMGLIWGRQWLRASFFPFVLFAFCVPLGSLAEPLSFPLRILVSKIVTSISHAVLGINVVRDGTRIFTPERTFEYEIAVACSGIRSLIAIFAVSTVYAFVFFKKGWKRLVLMGLAIPLAVVTNVFRMLTIVVAAEAFGQEVGTYIHEGGPLRVLSLLPYVPAIGGLLLAGHWLHEPEPAVAQGQKVETK